MKTRTSKNFLLAFFFGATIISGFEAKAQYPTASVLISASDVEPNSINSTEQYLIIEQNINTLAAKLRDAHVKYPNLKYTPAYHEGEIIAFIVTGVAETSAADAISQSLVQLEVLGGVVRNMNESFLPAVKDNKLSRVSRKVASL